MEPLAQREIMFIHCQWWLQKVLFYAQLAKAAHLILTKRLEQQVQPHFKQQIKDLVCCSLDVNILVQSNAAERRLFDCAVEAIDYYCPVQPPTPTKLVFLWLTQFSPLVSPSTDPDRIESKSHSDNCGKNNVDISDRVGVEELMTEEEFVTEEELGTELQTLFIMLLDSHHHSYISFICFIDQVVFCQSLI